MRQNKLRKVWADGGAILNGWLQVPNSFSAEVMAHQGWDSLTIDMQHGLTDYQTAVTMLQAISTTDVVPMARVPWNDPALIMRMLDAGCYALICPMVNSRTECEAFVGACRYPPLGYRSFGPTRARVYAGDDYFDHANDTVVTMAMVETAAAMENLDEILSTPGLDAIYIGPSDLGISLGLSERSDYQQAENIQILDQIVAACRQHNIVAGIHCGTAAYARRAIAQGFQFVTVQSDAGLMRMMALQVIAAVKEGNEGEGRKDEAGSLY